MKYHGHSKADARHLHLHGVALEKLLAEPVLKLRVLELLDRWLRDLEHASSRPWLEEWLKMLRNWPQKKMAEVVLDEEKGPALRQCSPLAPVLTAKERWAALKEINQRLDAAWGGMSP